MDFAVTDEIEALVARVTTFVDQEILPVEQTLLNQEFRDSLPLLAELRSKVAEAGLWAPHMPEHLGGMGLSLTEFAHVSEALGRTPFGHYIFNCQAPDVGNVELLARSEERRVGKEEK